MKKDDVDFEEILADRASEDIVEVPIADRIFKAAFILVSLSTAGIVYQLFNLGFLNHEVLKARAIDNMSDILIDPAPRGIIFDRYGKPLVENKPSYRAFLLPRNLAADFNLRNEEIGKIAGFVGLNQEVLKGKLQARNWLLAEKFLLADNLTQEELVDISSAGLKSVKIEPAFKRIHTAPLKFSHLVGFTGFVNEEDLKSNSKLTLDDEIGKSGLEGFYDEYLRGVNGEEVTIRDAVGMPRDERKRRLPEPGDNLKTFIDADLQKYFYDRLKKRLDDLGRTKGVGIALNPENGEVLSLVSIPGFDAGEIGKFLGNPDKPLFNRAVSGLYNPGSTIKPLHALAALSEGLIDPEKKILSRGFIEIPNPYFPENPSRFLDWKAHGWVDLRGALARSSNVYFYEVGGGYENQLGLGIERLKKWWERFFLDKKTGIDILAEQSGFLPDPEWKSQKGGTQWRIGDTYNVSIGQGDISITPIGLINYITAIANGGKLYKPRIVEAVLNKSSGVVKENPPEVINDFSKEVAGVIESVRLGMRDAVVKPYGTANFLSGLPITVAAKTGTAQIENNKKTNAFFVGFAPFENPKIAILILVEDSREGSLNAVPIANDIFMWYYENRFK